MMRHRLLLLALVCLLSPVGCEGAGSADCTAKQDTTRRIEFARRFLKTVEHKTEGFEEFLAPFNEKAKAAGGRSKLVRYDQALFDRLQRYGAFDAILEPTDIPNAAYILDSNDQKDPLYDLTQYSHESVILSVLIADHIEETNAEMQELTELLELDGHGAADSSALFAVSFDARLYQEQINNPDGGANFARSLRRVTKILEDPEEIAVVWKDLKSEHPEFPADKSPKVVYQLQINNDRMTYALADEVILIRRMDLFGATPNALARYEERMKRILNVISLIEASIEPLKAKLKAIAEEELP